MGTSLLEAIRLTYAAPGGRVLGENLSFALDAGELLVLSGPNGSGKSTLLSLILGEFGPVSGRLLNHVPRARTAVIPQLQNIEFHLPVTLRDVLEVSRPHSLSEEAVESFGLLRREQLDLAWNTSSGGERQRTLMTRALLQDPHLLILDEPFNHLDTISQTNILEAIAAFLKKQSDHMRAAVLVSHVALSELDRLGVAVKHVRLLKGDGS
jgi:ABC-type Mn2+/Zn2+ transport system ATPase subunit